MISDRSRDYYAGALIALIGAGAAYQGSTYGIGTLAQMESGFFPTMLGVGMILIGAAIAASGSTEVASPGPRAGANGHIAAAKIDWRGWFAIIGGVCLFMVLSAYAGLLPAIFACVFASALGSRTTTWKEAFILSAAVTVFGITLFAYGLKIQIPILQFPNFSGR